MEIVGPDAGTSTSQGSFPTSINPAGVIAGLYVDASSVAHGLLRDVDGTLTAFDVPGAGTASGQGTFIGGINPAGAITGNYVDAAGVSHGYLLSH